MQANVFFACTWNNLGQISRCWFLFNSDASGMKKMALPQLLQTVIRIKLRSIGSLHSHLFDLASVCYHGDDPVAWYHLRSRGMPSNQWWPTVVSVRLGGSIEQVITSTNSLVWLFVQQRISCSGGWSTWEPLLFQASLWDSCLNLLRSECWGRRSFVLAVSMYWSLKLHPSSQLLSKCHRLQWEAAGWSIPSGNRVCFLIWEGHVIGCPDACRLSERASRVVFMMGPYEATQS